MNPKIVRIVVPIVTLVTLAVVLGTVIPLVVLKKPPPPCSGECLFLPCGTECEDESGCTGMKCPASETCVNSKCVEFPQAQWMYGCFSNYACFGGVCAGVPETYTESPVYKSMEECAAHCV